jgi:peroxiredoxin/predicted 2-oxoglutarate/Fe(II)-dependent dioxygenase YbiX
MTLVNTMFDWGDRAPDFLLPNPDGKFGRFYDRFRGNLVVLFFFSTARDEQALRELRGFVERADAIEAAGAIPVAVSLDDPTVNAATAAACGVGFTLFSDPKGAITRGYGVGTGPEAMSVGPFATFIVDRNQRILRTFREATDGHAARALDYLNSQIAAREPGKVVCAQAPVLLIPNVFDAGLCARLIRDWQRDHAEGEVRLRPGLASESKTRAVHHATKKRLDHRPGQAVNRELIELVLRRISPEAFRAFQFHTVKIENFCIGAYDAARGDYFRPHRDNTTPQTADRGFAVTLNLNEDYDGGHLRFPEYGEQLYRTPTGGAIVFSCSLLHEAMPVTRGQRFVALTFLVGPDQRRRQGGPGPGGVR